MNFRKPRDKGLVKKIIRFQMVNSGKHLHSPSDTYALEERIRKSQEEMKSRVLSYNFNHHHKPSSSYIYPL